MTKHRKKPIVVDADMWWPKKWTLDLPEPCPQIKDYSSKEEKPGNADCDECHQMMENHGLVPTLEGEHIVCPGDWIIKGIKGEHYPCKPDIFAATYELVKS